MELHKWQQEAFNAWIKNGYFGTIKVGTGLGKTHLGLKAVEEEKGSIIIAVHTYHLQNQWKQFLEDYLDVKDIGFVGAGNNNWCRVTIAMIPSIMNLVLQTDLLIVDESHHLGQDNKWGQFIQKGKFKKVLLLSATPERSDDGHKKIIEFAPIIYQYSQREGIEDKLLCPYELLNIGVVLIDEEQKNYQNIDSFIEKNFPLFHRNFDLLQSKASGNLPINYIAKDLLKAFQARKQLLLNAQNKISSVLCIIEDEFKRLIKPKVIVFNEFIGMANTIFNTLIKSGYRACIYHSGLKLKERVRVLEDFRANKYDILVTVKATDEGINIPSMNVGIVVGGSQTSRQSIQRLGRLLRQEEGKKARFYQLYVKESQDFVWLKRRMEVFNGVAESIVWR